MTFEQLSKDLYDIFETVEYDEDGSVHITGTDRFSDNLRVEFSINTGIGGHNQLWEIQINGVRTDLIKSDFAYRIELFDEHPLLWPYTQLQTSLYFGRPTNRPYELLADIYQTHLGFTKRWFAFDKFINGNITVTELCKSTSGLFASGPVKLLEEYKKVLEKYDMNPTIIGGQNPKHWTNDKWVEEKERLSVLVIGDSYIVGESFEFSRV